MPFSGTAKGARLHFLPKGKNRGVAAVETGGKQGSTGALHLNLSSPFACKKSRYPNGYLLFWGLVLIMDTDVSAPRIL